MHRAALFLLIVALEPPAFAEDRRERRRTIAVTGQGEVKATPDRVEVWFAVETTAARAGEAVAENARRSAAVASALKSALGSEGSVTTTRYTIEPRYETARPGEAHEPRITGYVARNEVRVDNATVDKAGALLDAAVAAGANRVGGLEFSFAKQEELLRSALEKAGANARAQAESVARGLGVRLRGVISAATSAPPMPLRTRVGTMEMAAQARAAPTPIEPGEAAVSATLQVTYEIE